MKHLLVITNSFLQCNKRYRASPETFTFDMLGSRIQDQIKLMIANPKIDMARWSSNGWIVWRRPYFCVVIDPDGDIIQAADNLLYGTPSSEISVLDVEKI